jgi:hypothetical protein
MSNTDWDKAFKVLQTPAGRQMAAAAAMETELREEFESLRPDSSPRYTLEERRFLDGHASEIRKSLASLVSPAEIASVDSRGDFMQVCLSTDPAVHVSVFFHPTHKDGKVHLWLNHNQQVVRKVVLNFPCPSTLL